MLKGEQEKKSAGTDHTDNQKEKNTGNGHEGKITKKDTGRKAASKRRGGRGPTKKELQLQLESTRDELERLETRIASSQERIQELEDEKLRLYAEMDNARKRAQRRIEEERRRSVVDTIQPVLDVADNLERALRSAAENQSAEAILSGVEMVNRQLTDALAVIGIEVIDTEGATFDYNIHEAVGKTSAPGKAANEIVVEVSRGYLLEGRLLRPSRVIVASGDSD